MADRAEDYDREVIRAAEADMRLPVDKLDEEAARSASRRVQELSVVDAVRRRRRRRLLPGGGGSLI